MPDDPAPEKLSIVVFSGEFDKVHYALVLASAAAAIGRPVTLFFTMEACRALTRPAADGTPPWRAMPLSKGRGDGGKMDDGFGKSNVATFEELLSACVELGVRFLVCEMGLRAMGFDRADLREDLPIEESGAVTFLTDASKDGATLFV